MCEYCANDPEERRRVADAAHAVASRLERIANHYRALASGRMKPHTSECAAIKPTAMLALRDIVNDLL